MQHSKLPESPLDLPGSAVGSCADVDDVIDVAFVTISGHEEAGNGHRSIEGS